MNKKALLLSIIGVFLFIKPLSAQTWETTKRLTWNSSDSRHPAIAVDSKSYIYMVWHDYTSGNNEIFFKKSIDGGTTWSTKRLTWPSGESRDPAIAADSNNHIHVVWCENSPGNSEIYYKRSTNGGTTWTQQRLTWNSGGAYVPVIAIDSKNNIHVVWEEVTPGNMEIYYKKGIQ